MYVSLSISTAPFHGVRRSNLDGTMEKFRHEDMEQYTAGTHREVLVDRSWTDAYSDTLGGSDAISEASALEILGTAAISASLATLTRSRLPSVRNKERRFTGPMPGSSSRIERSATFLRNSRW